MRSIIAKVFGTKVDLKVALAEMLADLREEIPGMVQVEMPECDCVGKHKTLLEDREALAGEVSNLKRQKSRADESLAEAKLAHKITVEDIEHMQKLLMEKNQLANEKAVFTAEKKAQTEIVKIRDEYTKKLEEDLKSQQGQVKEMVEKIMTALPNVNVELGNRPTTPSE